MDRGAVTAYLLNNKTLFWLIALLTCFHQSTGQSLAFNHLTVENGLSHNAVLAIAQDSRGFMWYGTAIGLNRYDGHRFKVYKTIREDSSSLSNNYILSLLSDSEHTLWVGTSGGLNKYNPAKDAFERFYSVHQPNAIFCLYEDKQKNVWVGTNNGLFVLRGKEKNTAQKLPVTPLLSGNTIRCLYEDHNGYLWAGTTNGLIKLSAINGHYQYQLFRHEINNTNSISADFITSIAEDTYHNLWIGTHGGLNRYNSNNNTFTRFLHNDTDPFSLTSNNIRKIICDNTGKLWIGTQEGVNIIDPVTQKIQSYRYNAAHKKSLSQNSIYSLFQDASGTVWIGTYFGGVNAVYPYTTSFHVLQNNNGSSINNNVISSIVEDEQHNLWMGSEGGGLNYWNRTAGLFRAYTNKTNDPSSLSSNFVKVVYKDKEGNIWAGTHSGGLNVWDATHHRFHRFLYKENDAATLSSEVAALLEDSMGRFWVGNNAGLKIFRRNNITLEPWPVGEWNSQIANTYTRALLEDSKNQIWIGTADGLYVLSNNILKKVSDDYINCLTEDTKGTIWAGLHYGGLSYYDTHRQQLGYYTEKDGLPNNNVIGILEDKEHNLWLSTDNGLIKFNPAQKTFRTYTVSDGLADNAFNYNSFFKDSRGQFFFGGYNGLTYFFPNQIEVNHYAAPVVFTGLKVFNQPVPANEKNKLLPQDISTLSQLSFPYNKDVFTIEFALLNYIKSNKNKYAYRLEGFDKSWTETTMPSATYTNLPSGSYTFWIKGANNDGLWSKPVALRIQILPPFWRTWWAYCLYAIALSAIAFLLLRFLFLQALLKKEGELHQVKLNFFTNISHEIRTHLTLIMAPVEKILETKTPDDSGYQQLTSIKNNAGRLFTLVNELMDFRKAETEHLQLHIAPHDLISFLQNIYTSFREVSLTKQVRLSFVHDADTLPLYFDKGQMEKVFFNLLSNALKFTPAGGQIGVHVAQKANMVTISVTDDGRGIALEYLDKLFTNFFQVADYGQQNTGYGIGLALSKKLVELHGGTINVESAAS